TEPTVIACGRPRYFSRLSNFRSSCLAPEQKLLWLKITTAIALICGFALSFRLWISSRLVPLSPVSDSLPAVPFPFYYIWFFVLIGLLLVIIVIAQPRRLILAFLALAALLSLWTKPAGSPGFINIVLCWRQSACTHGRNLTPSMIRSSSPQAATTRQRSTPVA